MSAALRTQAMVMLATHRLTRGGSRARVTSDAIMTETARVSRLSPLELVAYAAESDLIARLEEN